MRHDNGPGTGPGAQRAKRAAAMARGFLSGAIIGTVVSGVTLGTVSVLTGPPQRERAALPLEPQQVGARYRVFSRFPSISAFIPPFSRCGPCRRSRRAPGGGLCAVGGWGRGDRCMLIQTWLN